LFTCVAKLPLAKKLSRITVEGDRQAQEPGRSGGGRCTGGGRRGAGSGIPKVAGSWMTGGILRKEAGANKIGRATGIAGYGRREVKTPSPSSPIKMSSNKLACRVNVLFQ